MKGCRQVNKGLQFSVISAFQVLGVLSGHKQGATSLVWEDKVGSQRQKYLRSLGWAKSSETEKRVGRRKCFRQREQNVQSLEEHQATWSLVQELIPQCWGHACRLESNILSGLGQLHKRNFHADSASAWPMSGHLGPNQWHQPKFYHFSLSFCTSVSGVTSMANSVHVASHLITCLYSSSSREQDKQIQLKRDLPGSRIHNFSSDVLHRYFLRSIYTTDGS